MPPLAIDFEKNPLVPAIIIDHETGEVLMLAFMNEEAYRLTRDTGRTHFWSRSRKMLWRKGATSGHEQIVHKMAINCEDNALLVTVEQLGAVCHTGHPTCFFRDIESDETLTVTTDRLFDPAVVYGQSADQTRLWYGAFEWLKSAHLQAVSSSSRLLSDPDARPERRVADELEELAGVLDGTHHHYGLPQDVLIEGSQVLYWLAMTAVRRQVTWEKLRPDRALDTFQPELATGTAASMLRAASASWRDETDATAASIHATMTLVAQAAVSSGIEPGRLIEHDLSEMRTRAYLGPYFARGEETTLP